jgi:hypothetical protein
VKNIKAKKNTKGFEIACNEAAAFFLPKSVMVKNQLFWPLLRFC